MYIAIAGNIGSGKTTLTEMLSSRLGMKLYPEDTGNPYLADFYEDMNRWSFNLQIYFLGSRIEQAMEILRSEGNLIQDRTIYEDAHIFATNLHQMGLMSSRDLSAYMKIFDIASAIVPAPDLLVYLKASVPTLVSQIRKRGRAYEMSIREDYLRRLNDKYEQWIGTVYRGQVVTIDVDRDDFVLEPARIEPLIARIEEMRAAVAGLAHTRSTPDR